jgi:DNA-binding MarR family transcriptional regulator/peroxiredoxin
MRADIVAGAVFPDYELTDHTGKHRKLSDLQGPDPMILVLSRGGYCPKDRRQAEGLVQLHHEMEVGYSRLVTISTDNMLLTNEYRAGAGAHWTFLSDPGRRVQKDLDIAEYTDPEHDPMIPHVIVLEPRLVIFKIYNGYWFSGRPTIEELRQDLLLHKGPLPVNTIGPIVDLTPGSISIAVDRLFAKGLVSRVESAEDRRVRIVALTLCGKELSASAFRKHSGQMKRVFSELSPEELRDLEVALKKVGKRAAALSEQSG